MAGCGCPTQQRFERRSRKSGLYSRLTLTRFASLTVRRIVTCNHRCTEGPQPANPPQSGVGNVGHNGIVQFPGSNVQLILARLLTAAGFRFRLRQYVKAAVKKVPSLSQKHVTPHLFRHTTAVHLVAAGVDVTVIRSWLGHASLDTTNHYAQAHLETKRNALEKANPKLRPAKPPRWKRDADLLAWLDSL